MAEVMLGHPVISEFPTGAVEALSAIADGQPIDPADMHLLVHTALSVIITAEVLNLREEGRS
jgi:hypothetical protein